MSRMVWVGLRQEKAMDDKKMLDYEDRLLRAEEAAEFLGLKVATVRRLTYTRELPCVHPTGKRAVRYRVRDLEALLRMRTQPMRTRER